MRPLRLSFAALLAVAVLATGAPASSLSGTDLVDACLANGGSISMCRGLYQTLRIPGGLCRDLASDDPSCALIDGIELDEALVDAHEHSWLADALALQRGLDDTRPLQDELWTHTHNSFNADAYPFQAAGGLDRNAKYTVRDQLRMGIRAVELDLHWVPNPPIPGIPSEVRVCHGDPFEMPANYHLGCEIGSPSFAEHAAEIRSWMDTNPDEIVMLYLENALEGIAEAHASAAATIASVFGDLVYQPSTNCGDLPMDTPRKTIRDSGARIIITGNCGPGAWGTYVHERGPRWKESGIGDGDDFPAYPCTAERAGNDYDTNLIRRYADETGLSAGAGAGGDVTPTDALNMTRCGVNLLGWDNLVPFDQRLVNVVWSWKQDEPSTSQSGFCASHDATGRFHATDCTVTAEVLKIKRPHRRPRFTVVEHFTAQPFACFDGTDWSVTTAAARFSDGDATCAAEGKGAFAVPWSGYENERLKDAKGSSGEVWLNYHAAGGDWIS